jgi:hypothetical protein
LFKYVFLVTRAINEFNAPAGSYLVYRPGHPTAELQIVRSVPQGRTEYLLKHSSHLELLHQVPAVQEDSAFLTALRDQQTRQLG